MSNDSEQQEKIGDYIITQSIREGTFSKTKIGIHKYKGVKVAIEIFDKSRLIKKKNLKRITRGIKILSKMDNEHIIKVYKIIENENNYFIIMEYCEGGELFDYIIKKK